MSMRLFYILLFFWSSFAAAREQSHGVGQTLFELSPLRSAMGLVAVRIEHHAFKGVSFAGYYDKVRGKGVRKRGLDETQRLGAEVVGYPMETLKGLFFGGGIGYQNSLTGYQRLRNYSTDVSYRADEQYDSWAMLEHRLTLPFFMGYRHAFSSLISGSVKLSLERKLLSTSKVVERDIKDYDLDPNAVVEEKKSPFVLVYLGVLIR